MDDWCLEAFHFHFSILQLAMLKRIIGAWRLAMTTKSRGVAQTVNQLAVKTMDRRNREKAKNLFQVSFDVAISSILVALF